MKSVNKARKNFDEIVNLIDLNFDDKSFDSLKSDLISEGINEDLIEKAHNKVIKLKMKDYISNKKIKINDSSSNVKNLRDKELEESNIKSQSQTQSKTQSQSKIKNKLTKPSLKIDKSSIKISKLISDVKNVSSNQDYSKFSALNKLKLKNSSKNFSDISNKNYDNNHNLLFKHIQNNSGLNAKKGKNSAEIISILTKKQDHTNRYINNLFEKKTYEKHFYDNIVETKEKTKTNKKEDEKNFDVLKEAIRLAQDVIKNQNSPNKNNSNNNNNNNSKDQLSELFDESIVNSDSDQNLIEDKESKIEDNEIESEELKKIRDEKRKLEEERAFLEVERERMEFEREKIKNLKSKKSDINKVRDEEASKQKEIDSKIDEETSKTQNLESKLNLLEHKLKNMDFNNSNEGFQEDEIFDEIEFVSEPVGDRAQTGIDGFDQIIQGGLRRLSTTLVAGGPGSGKTIFGMLYIINGIKRFNENGIFITLEQTRNEVIKLFKDFGWDLEKLEKQKKLQIMHFSPEQIEKMMSSGGGSLRDSIDSIHGRRIVIDSITDLMMLYKNDLAKRAACVDLFDMFKKLKCTSLIISEQEVNPLKHISNVLEYQVDGVILLYNERVQNVRKRALEIFKMRGTKHAGRIFPLRINDKGMEILSNLGKVK